MIPDENNETPWRDGNYNSKDGYFQLLRLSGENAVSLIDNHPLVFRSGDFGDASQNIVDRSGEKRFNVEVRFTAVGKEFVNLGVLLDGGTKFIIETILGIWTFDWVTEEEMDRLLNDGDPMTSPSCPHKAQPGRQGRLIWITGPPALGKSTTAQLLSREHGYVYYEGDCFFRLRNPYIPPNVENPSLAATKQRRLVGEGTKERWAIVNAGTEVWIYNNNNNSHNSHGGVEVQAGQEGVQRRRPRSGLQRVLQGCCSGTCQDRRRLGHCRLARLQEDQGLCQVGCV